MHLLRAQVGACDANGGPDAREDGQMFGETPSPRDAPRQTVECRRGVRMFATEADRKARHNLGGSSSREAHTHTHTHTKIASASRNAQV